MHVVTKLETVHLSFFCTCGSAPPRRRGRSGGSHNLVKSRFRAGPDSWISHINSFLICLSEFDPIVDCFGHWRKTETILRQAPDVLSGIGCGRVGWVCGIGSTSQGGCSVAADFSACVSSSDKVVSPWRTSGPPT